MHIKVVDNDTELFKKKNNEHFTDVKMCLFNCSSATGSANFCNIRNRSLRTVEKT